MSDLYEIKSPFLRKVLERRGLNDDQVTSLLIVERYQRWPDPTNSIVVLMLTAINRELPLEAAIVRREVELVRALTDKESRKRLRNFRLRLPGRQHSTLSQALSSLASSIVRRMHIAKSASTQSDFAPHAQAFAIAVEWANKKAPH